MCGCVSGIVFQQLQMLLVDCVLVVGNVLVVVARATNEYNQEE